jgi:hypothetical protein
VSAARTVAVEFVDVSTGVSFARSDIPAEQLPVIFTANTTLTLAGQSWTVVRAEPPTAAEFSASGRLVLTLSRVTPQDILYSLPTLCERLPAIAEAASDLDPLSLHEDDWQQVELISADLASVAATQLAAVRRVYDEQAVTGSGGAIVGFRNLHLRTAPASPLTPPIPLAQLHQMLPPQRTYNGVGFTGTAGTAVDSFAYGYGPVDVYGLAPGGAVTVLGLQVTRPRSHTVDTATRLAALMRAATVVLVDWCRCTMLDADSVGAYLQRTG